MSITCSITNSRTITGSMQIASIVDSLEPSVVNFTLVFDSCHSGGMFLSPDSRSYLSDKSAIQTFVDNCQTIVPWIGLSDPSAIDQNVGSIEMLASGLCTMTVDKSKDTVDQAKATLFSACDYSEESAESSSIGHGYFTKAIIDTVNACNFEMSHPDFLGGGRNEDRRPNSPIAGTPGSNARKFPHRLELQHMNMGTAQALAVLSVRITMQESNKLQNFTTVYSGQIKGNGGGYLKQE